MNIDIIECNPRAWFTPLSWMIRLHQGGSSHFAIGYVSPYGNYMILDATSNDVKDQSAEFFFEKYESTKCTSISLDYPISDILSWAEDLKGTRYGTMQLLGIMIKNKRLGAGIICNELVLRLLRRFTQYRDNNIDIRDLRHTRRIVEEISNG